MAQVKRRLDELLVRRGLCPNIQLARAWIMAGEVIVADHRADKPGHRYDEDIDIRIRARKKHEFVSRGGLKLAAAIQSFGLEVDGFACLDLGASTGGFTDCLLQSGAKRVYAVDVGYGLLDWSLRSDARVVNLERTHAKDLTSDLVDEPINLIVADISFNSLTRLLEPSLNFLSAGGHVLLLVKPQFEAERSEVGEGGIVTDPDVHARVLESIGDYLVRLGARLCGTVPSSIKGTDGNQEFLVLAQFDRVDDVRFSP
ncbi:MAG: TlyA family RNA methyltransferase [Myxococcota bacterium]|nr:TlyA family RNA methyltransferase [Myxococcota bacterium]